MAFVYFSAFDLKGDYRECCFGSLSLECCLDALSGLTDSGWHLIYVNYTEYSSKLMPLPVVAFDGEKMTEPINRLQQSWEEILISN